MPCEPSWTAQRECTSLMDGPRWQAPAELAALIEHLAVPAVLVDADGRPTALNAAAAALASQAPPDAPFDNLPQLAEALGDGRGAELVVLVGEDAGGGAARAGGARREPAPAQPGPGCRAYRLVDCGQAGDERPLL